MNGWAISPKSAALKDLWRGIRHRRIYTVYRRSSQFIPPHSDARSGGH